MRSKARWGMTSSGSWSRRACSGLLSRRKRTAAGQALGQDVVEGLGRGQPGLELGEEAVHLPAAGGEEDVGAAAGEPAVDAGPGHAGLDGDALHGHGPHAVLGDAGEGGVGDPARVPCSRVCGHSPRWPPSLETIRPCLSQGKPLSDVTIVTRLSHGRRDASNLCRGPRR